MPDNKKIQRHLAAMLKAYDNGDADEDRQGFIAGWADTIAPKGDKKTGRQYVLMHGHPFEEGLNAEGPYNEGEIDAQDLEDSGFRRYGGWWVVWLEEPTLLDPDKKGA